MYNESAKQAKVPKSCGRNQLFASLKVGVSNVNAPEARGSNVHAVKLRPYELLGLKLGFLGPKLVSMSSLELTSKLKAGPASACPLLRLLNLPPSKAAEAAEAVEVAEVEVEAEAQREKERKGLDADATQKAAATQNSLDASKSTDTENSIDAQNNIDTQNSTDAQNSSGIQPVADTQKSADAQNSKDDQNSSDAQMVADTQNVFDAQKDGVLPTQRETPRSDADLKRA
ncbi:hypothetical protein GMDG_03112 [Pseudogymnoascus destructans 20631-21]|uniref:Uncharacterized protein n=1 Tax=Pseudogymnoascus destructans (strain ATCC MYA-4855 / 20631-21) TaxID=658429 RepID=L8G5B0_PSED2|nr:hypothetical protein GMDG_03112 [Pseudogymnoascus destructans 20631-21]